LLRYKFEMARLERWAVWREWVLERGDEYPDNETLERWSDEGAEERIIERYIDSRAASSPRVENDRPVTLYEEFLDIGFDFLLTPGAGIDEGVVLINQALDYNEHDEGSFFNKSRLVISEDCENTIFALENWTGVDGQSGACKEPIDLLRYFYQAGLGYTEAKDYAPRGGFYYGRGVRRLPDIGAGMSKLARWKK